MARRRSAGQGEWVNWAGDQSCRPARDRRARPAARSWRRRSRGAAAAGRKVSVAGSGHSFTEAAMTDGHLDPDRGAERACSTPTPARAWSGSAPAPCSPISNEELARARAGDGEPRRHRPPDDRRRDLDRHPRHRRRLRNISAQVEGDGAGPRRRQRPPAQRRRPTRSCCGRRGSGSARWARSPRSPCAASPPSPCDRVDTPQPRERGARRLPASAPTPTTTSSSSPSPTPTAPWSWSATGPTQPPRPRGRAAAYLNDVVLENWALEALSADRQGASAARSRRSRGWPAGSPPAAAPSTAATASSPTTAASASPRWSTGCRASTGRRRRGG